MPPPTPTSPLRSSPRPSWSRSACPSPIPSSAWPSPSSSSASPGSRGGRCTATTITSARGSGRGGRGVFLDSDMLAPGDRAAGLVGLLNGDVRQEAVGRGTVPVVLAGLEEHAVAGPDLLDRTTLALAAADPLDDVDRLAERMGVPGGPGTRGEMHAGRGGSRRRRRSGDGIDVDGAGEPVAGSEVGGE